MPQDSDDPLRPTIERVLGRYRRIAVVGLSNRSHRASFQVAQYLVGKGYEVIPVNPNIEEVFGLKSYPDLTAIPGPIEVIDVFRRSEFLSELTRRAIQRKVHVIWTQLGVIDEKAAELARKSGVEFIMNRCIMVEHQRLKPNGL